MIQRMIGTHKSNWHLTLFSALWAYQTSTKTATSFTPFQLIYRLEVVILIECEIPSLKLIVELLPNTTIEEEHLIYLSCLMNIVVKLLWLESKTKKETNHNTIILYILASF